MKTQINEIKRMQQLAGLISEAPVNYPTLVEVIKNGYYCVEDANDGEYYENVKITQPFVVGDVWKLIVENGGEPYYECIEGKQKGKDWDAEDINDNNKAKKFFKVKQQ
jgi:hypothetical protein